LPIFNFNESLTVGFKTLIEVIDVPLTEDDVNPNNLYVLSVDQEIV
jgi:hypothetical protein